MGKKNIKKTGAKTIILSVISFIVVGTAFFFLLILNGSFGSLPGTDELKNIQNYKASQIYSADQKLLGTYYLQNRTEVKFEEINPVMIDALLAVEDIRFYEHNGIDKRALARVAFRTLLLRQNKGGGSTITQQLAKNLYPRENNGFLNLVADKIREMIIAKRLETVYSKDQILELYLNTVSFGEEIFGIDMASRRFFDKKPADLEIHEAGVLAGMLRATTWYNPHRNPQSALQRRNLVVRQMEKYGKIDSETADSAIAKPISTNYSLISTSDGPAAYFREHLKKEVRLILNGIQGTEGQNYNIYTDGLIIYTTLDSRIQEAAEQAVQTQMKYLQSIYNGQNQSVSVFADIDDPAILQAWKHTDHYKDLKNSGATAAQIDSALYQPTEGKVFTWNGYEDRVLSPYDELKHYLSFLNTGFLAMSPSDGSVLAWVGGINHRHYKYDHVLSKRQPGSAFKPIVYSTALEQGFKPCDYRRNIVSVYKEFDEWMPQNVNAEYGGRYSIQSALANSINTISVDLLMDTGIQNVQQTAANLGIQSRIPAEPSIALGSAEVSLFELVSAYSAFINEGIPASPKLITSIYTSEGDLVYEAEKSSQNARSKPNGITSETAAAIVHMLSDAVNSGTGTSLRTQFGITHALAGKTGTTQNYTDGWFIGMTPDMVFGSWVGGSVPRVRLRGNMGYASQTALPVAGHFLTNLAGYSDIVGQRSEFYDYQLKSSFDFSCEDYKKDSFSDRLRDFFAGRDSDDPRVVEKEDEKKGIFGRIKSIFSKD